MFVVVWCLTLWLGCLCLVMWSELLMTSAICCHLWLSGYECHESGVCVYISGED